MLRIKMLMGRPVVGVLIAIVIASGPGAVAAEPVCDEHGVAAYAAVQLGTTVTVFANGVHNTTGFTNCLLVGPEDIFPPIFDFKIKRPTGIVIPMLVPFVVRSEFQAPHAVSQVTVRDANGPHQVNVVQLSTLGHFASKRLHLESTYQHSPVDLGLSSGFHGIEVVGRIADGQTVDLALDPNTCSLNEFGDRVICTAMAVTRIKAKLTQLRRVDPEKLGRSIYEVTAPEFPKSLQVYLVAPRTDSGYRIVLQGVKSTVVVALEKRGPASAPPAAGGSASSGEDATAPDSREGLCHTVDSGSVGESGASHLLHHKVTGDRQIIMVVRRCESDLCGNTGAIALLAVNGVPRGLGDITREQSLIQVNANPGDRITAVVHTIPLFNGIVCTRLGELKFRLEQCDLE